MKREESRHNLNSPVPKALNKKILATSEMQAARFAVVGVEGVLFGIFRVTNSE